MSFGLTNALTTYMELMNIVIHDFLDRYVIVFIGDIFVHSRSKKEHTEQLNITETER